MFCSFSFLCLLEELFIFRKYIQNDTGICLIDNCLNPVALKSRLYCEDHLNGVIVPCIDCQKEVIVKSKFYSYQKECAESYFKQDHPTVFKGGISLSDEFEGVYINEEGELKHKVVTLCGSTRFKTEFEMVNKDLSLKGYVVLTLGFYSHMEGISDIDLESVIPILESVQRYRISISDELFVINPGKYIGESTREEINYAISKGLGIKYLE